MYNNTFTGKFGSSLWGSGDYNTISQYEDYAKRLGGNWTADKLYNFQTANNGALPDLGTGAVTNDLMGSDLLKQQSGLAASGIGDLLGKEEGFAANGATSKGYFDKLLAGDSGALGSANLFMKGAGLAAQLVQLPDMLDMNKEALKGARITNEQAKRSLDYSKNLSNSAFS
jgi:hypothetical protein